MNFSDEKIESARLTALFRDALFRKSLTFMAGTMTGDVGIPVETELMTLDGDSLGHCTKAQLEALLQEDEAALGRNPNTPIVHFILKEMHKMTETIAVIAAAEARFERERVVSLDDARQGVPAPPREAPALPAQIVAFPGGTQPRPAI